MIQAILITDWCRHCSEYTEQELDTVACVTECLMCRFEEVVSESYVKRMLEED